MLSRLLGKSSSSHRTGLSVSIWRLEMKHILIFQSLLAIQTDVLHVAADHRLLITIKLYIIKVKCSSVE
jgi:hypothetical protein